MSILKWFNKILGIDDPKSNNDMPSKFRVPTENANIDDNIHNRGHNYNNDPFIFEMTNDFDQQLKKVTVDLGGMLGEMLRGLQIPDDDSTSEDNIINFIENRNFNQEEFDNGVPKKNFLARYFFLSPRSVKPAAIETISPNFEQINKSYSHSIGNWNGRRIEKETTARELPDGSTEEVTVLRDGIQKCIITVTENSKTGELSYNKQLINLDKSQAFEFENRFEALSSDENFMFF